MCKLNNIRNFCIIAHIDHGKSTLADRLIEYTGTVSKRNMYAQILDQMDLEQEKGITIKLQAIKMEYIDKKKEKYLLNLIDTPGHVDFSYEVSRSLAACEGALLIIDATQGIEAQTLSNLYLAIENKLKIIIIINKIDLPNADPGKVLNEIRQISELNSSEIIYASAKTGEGTEQILEAIINWIPSPIGNDNAPLKALIFDSQFDQYKGILSYIRLFDGIIKKGMKIKMMSTNKDFEVTEVGVFDPKMKSIDLLKSGEVGYVAASIKYTGDVNVGDSITDSKNPTLHPLKGYKKIMPMVYCGVFPINNNQYNYLKESLSKLKLNDASLSFEVETSSALGFGFRCGFLGLLHMEIIKERLEREYKINLIITAPSVVFSVYKKNKTKVIIDTPSKFPPMNEIDYIKEVFVKGSIIVPNKYIGDVMKLCQEKRGSFLNMFYITKKRVFIIYKLPLSEIIYDFYDKLKSKTKGYASFDYEVDKYEISDLVKLDISLSGEVIDAFSCIVHKEKAYYKGKAIVSKLKKTISRQLFEVSIQAIIGNKVISRETIKAIRKDVLEKCYGGDISRKKKLLEKQKEGKKRMKQVGKIEISQEAFLSALSLEKD